MRPITLTVNGRSVTASVEPRTHLADFLRETLTLTGTHLGCEHGVCGACTLLVDGVPVRSCITYAVACEGANVTTIEGLDKDEIAADLRAAFSREHGLQCGYCTPGMLVSARDVVMRMPDAGEREIRVAMSGNLCRCTGYAGIVRAIQRVLSERKARALATPANPRLALGPAGSGHAQSAASDPSSSVRHSARAPRDSRIAPDAAKLPATATPTTTGVPQTTLHESFIVDFPREQVWAFFGKPGEVATCLPGASIVGTPKDDHIQTKLRVRAGPIAAEFDGAADVTRNPLDHSGVIRGTASDARSRSTTRGEIRYRLHEEKAGVATRVDIDIGFTLTGPLAQFSRSSLVRDIARRMTEHFAKNLQARLSGGETTMRGAQPAAELNAGSLVLPVLWERIRRFFSRLFRG
jgi:aerobic carbon-monoxide dehydrogenase small subunit